MALDLTKLQASVSEQTTVEASAVTLLQQLAAEIQAAAGTGDQTAVNALADQIKANADALAAAVAANTPAAPPPTP